MAAHPVFQAGIAKALQLPMRVSSGNKKEDGQITQAFYDTGCTLYGLVSRSFAKKIGADVISPESVGYVNPIVTGVAGNSSVLGVAVLTSEMVMVPSSPAGGGEAKRLTVSTTHTPALKRAPP
jgi:hypothetical protein